MFAPKSNNKYKVERVKRKVTTRPLPQSQIPSFGQDIQSQSWIEVFEEPDLDRKVENFHKIITTITDKYFPEKHMTISNLGKVWMTPQIRQVLRKVQSEYFRKGKSQKWRKLKSNF